MHGGYFLAMVIEYCFNNIEFKLRHLIPIFLFGLIYLGVNSAYTLLTGNIIYPGIDYKSYLCTILLLICILLIIFWFWLGYYIFKKFKFQRILKKYKK